MNQPPILPFSCSWDIIRQAAVLGIALVASGEDVGSEVRQIS